MSLEKDLIKSGIKTIFIIVSTLLLSSFFIDKYNLDLKLAAFFYEEQERFWLLDSISICLFLYRYGTIPGLIITISLLILWALSFYSKRLVTYRKDFLLCFLAIVIGGGVIVNAVLKDHFGRPRPRQVIEFGGKWAFKPPLIPGIPGKGKSFPCGHCAMGFVPVVGIFLYYRSKKIAFTSFLLTITYGVMVSVTRIGQGAHFLSDAIWSLGIMLLTSAVLFYFIIKPKIYYINPKKDTTSPLKQKLITLVTSLTIIIMSILFLTRRPFYEERKLNLSMDETIKEIVIETNINKDFFYILKTKNQNNSYLKVEVKGFGFPNADADFKFVKYFDKNTITLKIMVTTSGYFSEKNIKSLVYLPGNLLDKVKIRLSSPESNL